MNLLHINRDVWYTVAEFDADKGILVGKESRRFDSLAAAKQEVTNRRLRSGDASWRLVKHTHITEVSE